MRIKKLDPPVRPTIDPVYEVWGRKSPLHDILIGWDGEPIVSSDEDTSDGEGEVTYRYRKFCFTCRRGAKKTLKRRPKDENKEVHRNFSYCGSPTCLKVFFFFLFL